MAAGAASTILGTVPLPGPGADADEPHVVDDVGAGSVVDEAVPRPAPAPSAPIVDGEEGRTATGGPPPAPETEGTGTGVGAVPVVVVTDVVVVDPDDPEVSVARTALGGNDGCPSVPSMSVAPNVHASTLPPGG